MKIVEGPDFQKSIKRMVWRRRLEPINPKEYWHKLKSYHQRGKRGWADSDVWNLHSYLTDVIAGTCREMAETHHGVPGSIVGGPFDKKKKMSVNAGSKKWKKILNDIADGFEAYEKFAYDYELDPRSTEYKRLERKFNKGVKLFHQYFGNLWD